ncbi:hypothetical protein ABVT39_020283 [Epinephelus coioides]
MELSATTQRLTIVTQECDDAENLLKKAAKEIRDLKAQVRIQYEDIDQEQISDLRQQLADSKDRVTESQHQQFIKEEELADANRELQYSFEQSQSRRVFHNEPPLEAKRNTKSLKSPQEDLPLQSSPLLSLERASCSRDTRPPLKQVSNIYAQHPHLTVGAHFAQGLSDRDLDKIARNITRFEPNLGGSHDTNLYLRDIDFYLRKLLNTTVNNKIYLIKVTSSRDVSAFIDRPFLPSTA